VLFAGVFANFLLAWVLFSVGFISGIPTSVGNEPHGYAIENSNLVIVSVLSDSPAERAGLMSGNRIVRLQSDDDVIMKENLNPITLKEFIISHPNTEINIDYLKSHLDEMVKTTTLTPAKNNENGTPTIGIAMDQIGTLKLPILKAFWEGLKLDWYMTKGTAVGFFTLIKSGLMGEGDLSSVTGPVGMVGIVGDASQFGFTYLLSFAALISINLAVINLIPFPALDGGRLLFLLIEKIKGSRLNPKFANTANMVGFAILLIFMLVVTYKDIVRLF
ncbi:MAG: M50 family metallopeptidase, partial [Patescibacteria group bacterium]